MPRCNAAPTACSPASRHLERRPLPEEQRLPLQNYGAVTTQTTLNGATGPGQGAAETVDTVYTVGQSTSTPLHHSSRRKWISRQSVR